jgi:peptide/nickel transport system permease protein
MRLVRSITLTTREELYVAAAEVSGLSRWQVITRHLFPRVKATLFVQAALIAAIAILIQTALAFLGFGPRPPEPSWGGLVAEARVSMLRQNWLLVPSGVVIALTVLALTVLGNAARDQSTAVWAPSKLRRQPTRTSQSPIQTRAQIRDDSAVQSADSGHRGELLEVEGLTVGFPTPAGPGEIVSDVSFTVRRGEIFGIVGESGCGKSVTASAVLGMVPGTGIVTAGRCFFEDRDLVELEPDEWSEIRGRRIGFVAQEPMVSLDPTTRVGSQVAEAVRTHHKCSRPIANERAVELLRMVNLAEPRAVARRYPHQLSGGMAQRVAIAFALAGDPDLLVADEPTTALDVTVQAEILALLRRLCTELDMSVLLITHNWGVVAELCDRALVMYAGQIVEQAPSQVLFDGARHPYTQGLLKSNPSLAERGGRLPAIEGTVPSPADWPTGCRFSDRCYAATDACRAAVPPIDTLTDGAEVRCIRWRDLQRSAA